MITLVYNPCHFNYFYVGSGWWDQLTESGKLQHIVNNVDDSVCTIPVCDSLPSENFYFVLDINHVDDYNNRSINTDTSGSFKAIKNHPVPNAVLHRIEKKTAKFLLVRPYHGYSQTILMLIANIIIEQYLDYNLSLDDFVFLLPSSGKKSSPDLNIVDHTIFERDVGSIMFSSVPNLSVKKYRFSCLNRLLGDRRLAVVCELYEYRERGILTALESPSEETVQVFLQRYPQLAEKFKALQKLLPLSWDHPWQDILSGELIIPREQSYVDQLQNCYLSIVNESQVMTTNYVPQWHSEKIYKAILTGQPFIAVGQFGTLAALRDQGYRTFYPYIDESYDSIVNETDRVMTAMNEAKRIITMSDSDIHHWYQNVFPIIMYNHELLQQRSKMHTKRVNRDLKNYLTPS